MNLNKKQLLERRAQRHRKTFTVSLGPRIFLVIVLGSVGFVGMLALAMLSLFEHHGEIGLSSHYRQLAHAFADPPIDLWPSDRQSNILLDMLVSCLPQSVNDETCQQRRIFGPDSQRIALVSPPGVFGKIFRQFIAEVVENHPMENDRAVLVPVTNVPKENSFTKVIRLAVLPTLLEAADLILETLDSYYTRDQVKLSDLEDVVRLLIHWHCQQSRIADDTAMLTLSAKRVMSRPKDSAIEVGKFIGFSISSDEDMMTGDSADRRATLAMSRIDECSRLVSDIQKLNPTVNLKGLADIVIHETITQGTCGDIKSPERLGRSRVGRIVGQLVGPNSEKVCDDFPTIAACNESPPR